MKNKSQIHTLKKVFRYLGRYRIFVMISMVLAAATVGLTLYVPMLTGEAVDHILGPENVDFQKIVITTLQNLVVNKSHSLCHQDIWCFQSILLL